jgi:hypothetical protein
VVREKSSDVVGPDWPMAPDARSSVWKSMMVVVVGLVVGSGPDTASAARSRFRFGCLLSTLLQCLQQVDPILALGFQLLQ